MNEEWDGMTERRRTPPVVEEVGKRVADAISSAHNGNQPIAELNLAQQLIIAAVVVVMLVVVLLNQFRLMTNVNEHRNATREFQRELVCLLLIPPEQRTNDALARCGLIRLPGEHP